MNTVWALLRKDLRRDWKRPWSMLLFAALPLIMTSLIAVIFGGSGDREHAPTIHVAILDQDEDLLSGMLRMLPTQGDTARNLRVQFVQNREEGIRLIEKRRVSAFIMLPEGMTEGLLNGRTNAIVLYENPAQRFLPRVVRQGVSLLAVGLSGVAEILGEPLRELHDLVQAEALPADAAVTGVSLQFIQELRQLEGYLFPPLVGLETVSASEYTLQAPEPRPETPTP